MEWQDIVGNAVFIPPRPKGIVHFLGGAFVAAAPQVTYRFILESVARQGYAIIATSFVNTLDHGEIAQTVLSRFEQALDRLYATRALRRRYLPIYGMGHSMGCKLHLLIGSLFSVERSGNILISFNNFPARRSIPLVEQIAPVMEVEFTPTPSQTMAVVAHDYQIRRNLLIKFTRDDLDQTTELYEVLQRRFPNMTALQTLSGTHNTPIGQDVSWRAGSSFSPIDALGQWMKQEMYRDLNQLGQEIARWLDPMGANRQIK
ncbi:MAG: DUF1350 family protein [Cyanobacteriota bacterium]|nr:DUF1350 family protein [Cyanobacteriota bacterium]